MKRIQLILNENVNLSNLKSIFETLIKTENKIKDLQQFSTNDFSLLNQKFLAFHKVIKSFVIKVLGLNKQLWNVKNNDNNLEKSLKQFEKILSLLKSIKTNVTNQADQYKMLYNMLGYINVPLNNYRQNLFTLKFLSTNLKIDILTVTKKKQISGKIDDLILILEHICLFVPKIDKRIEEYQHLTDKLSYQLNSLSGLLISFESDLSEIFKLTNHYITRLELAKNINKDIEISNEASLKNVEIIITKLQYQDIISQRINHLTETHNETIENLKIILNKKSVNETSESVFIKIKDIVGLQSTHLIHINHEFQQAIETISESIRKYNQNISHFTDLSSELILMFTNIHSSFNSKSFGLENLKKYINDFESQKTDLSLHIHEQENKSNEFSNCFNEVYKISKHIEKIYKTIQNVSGSDTLKKISDLLKDNLDFTAKIDNIIRDFKHIINSSHIKNNNIISEFNELVNGLNAINLDSFYDFLYKIDSEIESISTDIKHNKNEQKSIIDALNDLKYYQYFENNVNEIIEHLKSISEFLSSSYQDKNEIKRKNVEHIKKRYTTFTEHNVHDKFSDKEEYNLDKLINSLESINDEDADNIEFF